MRIYLIGFMGSGKSYLGRQLAKHLDYAFIDLDTFIEQLTGRSIHQYFNESEEAFRKAEAACLRRTGKYVNTIIATGGGAPCYSDNMDWINAHGLSVYLKASNEALYKRLAPQRAQRPLLAGLNDEALLSYIQEKLAEREPVYLRAKHSVPGDLEMLMALFG